MSDEGSSDEELGLRVAKTAPDERAKAPFDELYRRLAGPTERFIAARVNPHQVADLHQETWLKAWSRAGQFVTGKKYRNWLLTIAANSIKDAYRVAQRKPPPQPLGEDRGTTPVDPTSIVVVDPMIAREDSEALAECLKKLTARAAELVKGRTGGRSYNELCVELGLTSAAAHKTFFMAKKQLQDCLTQRSDESTDRP